MMRLLILLTFVLTIGNSSQANSIEIAYQKCAKATRKNAIPEFKCAEKAANAARDFDYGEECLTHDFYVECNELEYRTEDLHRGLKTFAKTFCAVGEKMIEKCRKDKAKD